MFFQKAHDTSLTSNNKVAENEINKEKREVDLYFVNCLNREDWLSNFLRYSLPETIDGI